MGSGTSVPVTASFADSFSLGHPDHLSGVGDVVVLDDLAGCVELPELTVVGERVVLAPDRSALRSFLATDETERRGVPIDERSVVPSRRPPGLRPSTRIVRADAGGSAQTL
jgi:hypothetical protein